MGKRKKSTMDKSTKVGGRINPTAPAKKTNFGSKGDKQHAPSNQVGRFNAPASAYRK